MISSARSLAPPTSSTAPESPAVRTSSGPSIATCTAQLCLTRRDRPAWRVCGMMAGMSAQVEPVEALRQIAFQLERGGAPTYRVQAFRRAAEVLDGLPAGELGRRIEAGTLEALKGIGATTAEVITQAAAGEQPAYLARLLAEQPASERTGLRAALRGDCHTHSTYSDGGS